MTQELHLIVQLQHPVHVLISAESKKRIVDSLEGSQGPVLSILRAAGAKVKCAHVAVSLGEENELLGLMLVHVLRIFQTHDEFCDSRSSSTIAVPSN